MTIKDKVFSNADLSGKDWDKVQFKHCKLVGVEVKFANFSECVFEYCDLTGVVLVNCNLTKCKFGGSKLNDIEFSGVGIKECDFEETVMMGCSWQQLRPGSKFLTKPFDLRGCRFTGTDMSNSVLVQCNLIEVNFDRANLARVVFEKCNLTGARLVGANIEGVGWETATVKNTVVDMGGMVVLAQSRGFVLPE